MVPVAGLPVAGAEKLVVLALVLLATSCAPPGPRTGPPPASVDAGPSESSDRSASAPVHIQILAIDDFHGNLEPPAGSSGVVLVPRGDPMLHEHPGAGGEPSPDGRNVLVPAGGVAYLATYVKRLRRENPNTVVVSAGDLTGASPLVSNLFLDEPTVLAMNLVGLDYEGVGNHDFDRGLTELERLAHGGCTLGDCDAGAFPGAHFEYLAANVRRRVAPGMRARGGTVFPPYGVRDVAGVRLAFIGLTLEDTPSVTVPDAVRDLEFSAEAKTVNDLLPELARQRVDQVVVLVHDGAHQKGGTYDSCENPSGGVLTFLATLSPQVDVVLSGHTHEPYDCVLDGRIVTSAASYGRIVTRVDLTFDPDRRVFLEKKAKNLVVTRDVPPDPDVQALVDKYEEKAKPITSRVVGYMKDGFTRGNLAERPGAGEKHRCESPAGELIADAQLAATRARADGGAEVAFMNPGGVRTDLLSRAGEAGGWALTYADAFEVQPFGNRLVTMTLTGAQIQRLLETQLEVGRLLQISKGFTYRLVLQPGPGGGEPVARVEPGSARLDGKPLAPARKYRVTVNSFLAAGGDRFTILTEGTDRRVGPVDVDALAHYLTSVSSPARPLDASVVGGRIGGDFCR